MKGFYLVPKTFIPISLEKKLVYKLKDVKITEAGKYQIIHRICQFYYFI